MIITVLKDWANTLYDHPRHKHKNVVNVIYMDMAETLDVVISTTYKTVHLVVQVNQSLITDSLVSFYSHHKYLIWNLPL